LTILASVKWSLKLTKRLHPWRSYQDQLLLLSLPKPYRTQYQSVGFSSIGKGIPIILIRLKPRLCCIISGWFRSGIASPCSSMTFVKSQGAAFCVFHCLASTFSSSHEKIKRQRLNKGIAVSSPLLVSALLRVFQMHLASCFTKKSLQDTATQLSCSSRISA
jgi:hypothetical protein